MLESGLYSSHHSFLHVELYLLRAHAVQDGNLKHTKLIDQISNNRISGQIDVCPDVRRVPKPEFDIRPDI